MSFSMDLTDEQRELVASTHRFAEEVIRPVAAEYDLDQGFPWPVLEQAAEAGFYDPMLYANLNRDPSGLSIPLFIEEIFWGCGGIGLSIVYPALALAAIGASGTDEQVGRWAPECFGEPGNLKLAALCVTEPHGGSDVGANTTSARREGDEWVINGRKMFIGNGGIADIHVVNATVDPEAGHGGQAMFVVPKGTPGLKMVRKLDKLGCRGSHHAEVAFEECRIPADHLLGTAEHLEEKVARGREQAGLSGTDGSDGRQGKGGSSTLSAFEKTRPSVAAQAIGVARAAYEYARDYATEREAFGSTIIEHQGTSFPLADVGAAIDSARLLTWRASWMAANGVDFVQGEGSMSKLVASEVAVQATERAVQTLGGWGYIYDHPVERWYRDAKVFSIYEGTSEIQRMIIGRVIAAERGQGPLHHRTANLGG